MGALSPPAQSGTEARFSDSRRVTVRAVLLGLALIPVNAYWVVTSELRWYMILTLNPLFVTPIFFLLLLLAVNALLVRLRPRWTLSAAELLTVYIMVAISCTVASLDYIVNWVRMIGWGARFASPENKWESTVFPYVPRWTLMWDQSVLRGFFEGGDTLYNARVLAAWAQPLIAWTVFMLLSFGLMFCLNATVRRSWIEHTKLSFPIVRLPLAMCGVGDAGFFRSQALWVGMALPILNGTMNGLALIYPGVPHFQTSARFPAFTDPPLNLIGWMPVSLYPFAIGLAYFVPLDVLFSCWFFYLFGKLQPIVGYYFGASQMPGFPFQPEQASGAWLTYALLLLWITRHEWRALGSAFVRRLPLGDDNELLPYRFAGITGLMLLGLLLAFWRMVGMGFVFAVMAVGTYFLVALAITRVRAETGAPHDVVSPEPMNVFGLVGSRLLRPGDIVGAGLSHWFWRFNRSHAMPTQLEALKIGKAVGVSARSLAMPMLLATLASCVAAPWAALHVSYRDGTLAKCIGFKPMTGQEMWDWMSRLLSSGSTVEGPRLIAMGAGAALVLLLWATQARFTSMWLHPLGYCAGPSLNWVWFPFLIAWVLKAVILRYGGDRGYRRLIPFFLGLVLGDYITGAVWALVSPALGMQGYKIFH